MSRCTLDPAAPVWISRTGLSPSLAGFPKTNQLSFRSRLQSEPRSARTAVWPPPLSLAATHSIDVSFFSSGYLDVSVHRVPLRTLWIGVRIHEVRSWGFPHSDICGSMDICSSPQLFAACHVLLRLLVPRHPPCALLRFNSFIYVASYINVVSLISLNVSCTFQKNPMDVVKYLFN